MTGADTQATLDERPLQPWFCGAARAGQLLRLAPPRAGQRWPASRAYLCVQGGINAPVVLGSRSTQLRGAFGGHEGRALRAGDRLPIGAAAGRPGAAPGLPPQGLASFGIVPPALSMPLSRDGMPALRAIAAAEHERFTEASREAFWSSPWKITSQSDRYGYRLAGTALMPIAPMEMRSHGIVPGVIQVPPGGQPIVQMRDAQPSGGYPKIGTVIDADLWRLGQMPIGTRFRLIEVGWGGALAALEENRRWIAQVARAASLARLGTALPEAASA